MKIIFYLRRRSLVERFRRKQSIQMLRHIVYMLIILSITGIPLRAIFIQAHINQKLVPYYAQKLGMLFVTFSHAGVMIYILLLTADVRRSLIQSLRFSYKIPTQIEHIAPMQINVPRLNINH
ncbi:unnamed protein product [Rotaria socialis]|uniref:Uncharacterized protein n=1 Tax=Rotaria socialis TaxID=392032 RepID=A0A820GEK6_9BILA|nr:unnamed protein product [Rotaria socialis]CAF3339668.1 unnamed protein product [Rotaria socialis]CAF3412220.1 unnamed protein product [Rotaria socialis]CAF3465565.1 unnamed protein product [Rotaria socialis]CAF3605263.1 unnamed protein product [Rotaria socialis]